MDSLIIDKISDITNTNKYNGNVEWLLIEYTTLFQKKTNLIQQKFYSVAALDSLLEQLKFLKYQYSFIYWDFNFSSIDTLIIEREKRIKMRDELESYQELSAKNQLILNGVTARISYYNDLIRLKSKTEYLLGLDYYYQNPEALSNLIE